MPAKRGVRPAHLVIAVLAIAPAVKVVGWLRPYSGPAKVRPEAVAVGHTLFDHEWSAKDPMAGGDGLGPVFNARSCLECHSQGGGGGGGPASKNVTVYGVVAGTPKAGIPAIGVVHVSAIDPSYQETLNLVHPGLPRAQTIPLATLVAGRSGLPSGVTVTQRNTPALFGDGLLDAVPEDVLHTEQKRNSAVGRLVGMGKAKDPSIRGRVARLADGRLGRFGWKAEFATLDEFVRAACANELGLSNPTKPQAISMARRDVPKTEKTDLTDEQCVMIGDYLRSLPAPVQSMPDDSTHRADIEAGAAQFAAIGCADCHTPDLGPISGFYSNLLLHDMGAELASSTGYYGEPPLPPSEGTGPPPSVANEWKTPPLWGVADSAPYLHDGRANTLEDAILAHRGEASGVTTNYKDLKEEERQQVLAFLGSLKAPGPQAPPASTPGVLATVPSPE